MNLSRVRIKNFKGIEEKELLFIPGFNLIKGENGKGKTSILEAISVGMGGFIAGFACKFICFNLHLNYLPFL